MPVSPAPRVDVTALSKPDAERAQANLRVFDTVWDTVHRKYYDPTFNGLDWAETARRYETLLLDALRDGVTARTAREVPHAHPAP